MLPCSSNLSILFLFLIFVGEFSMIMKNINATSHDESVNAKRGYSFATTKNTSTKYSRISGKRQMSDSFRIQKRSTNFSQSSTTENLDKYLSRASIESRKNNEKSPIISSISRKNYVKNPIQGIADQVKKEKNEEKLKKEYPITKDYVFGNMTKKYFSLRRKKKCTAKKDQKIEPLDVLCSEIFMDESSLSSRNLLNVTKAEKIGNCSSQRAIIMRTEEEPEASLAAPIRFIDRGHVELIDQYEKERSMKNTPVKYVNPKVHNSHFPRTTDLALSVIKNQSRKNVFSINAPSGNIHYNEKSIDHSPKMRRNIMDMIMENRRTWSNEYEKEGNNFGKLMAEGSSGEKPENLVNSSSHLLMSWYDFNEYNITENPWPLVPGPISCDLDFQLEPSFLAKLGEFDYVVSVQRQRNPDEPAEHVCTGVIYNPRFVVIAPHCLHDNYGLTVTSTDDLCTIDEMIDVDYIIEHENYDAETRKNDIALIKLKSEIHKKAAKFPKGDVPLGKIFYAVGFGELMWKTFPKSVGKLLQKVPVQRYPDIIVNEAPGTLHITTSHMDLTGAFRGDLGGALMNLRGEFVGLKSKFVKRSMNYEIYTAVRAYLPWIKSMVALHGSW